MLRKGFDALAFGWLNSNDPNEKLSTSLNEHTLIAAITKKTRIIKNQKSNPKSILSWSHDRTLSTQAQHYISDTNETKTHKKQRNPDGQKHPESLTLTSNRRPKTLHKKK